VFAQPEEESADRSGQRVRTGPPGWALMMPAEDVDAVRFVELAPADESDREDQQQEIADVDEKLDAQAGGEGLAAEAARGENTGISVV
jgi:hypothetical protein